MRAWLIDQLNGIENARLTEVADPVPAAGEVLLRLTCAALNPADRYLAQGEYPARPPLPHILGRDGSGVVAGCGSGVQGHAIGDKRAILRSDVGVSRWGTFADLVTVPAARAVDVMKRVAAASVPVHRIGATGGETIVIPGERAIAIKALADRFEGWLPAYMSGAA